MGNDTACKASVVSGAVGQATCGIIHDLANLLQTILLRAEVTAATENVSPTCAKRLEQIVVDSKKSADVMRSLLEFARTELDAYPKTDLAPSLTAALEDVRAAAPVAVETELLLPDPPLALRADPVQVGNLVAVVGRELLLEASPPVRMRVRLAPATEAGGDVADAMWLEEAGWMMLAVEREGKGSPIEFEEGALPALGPSGELSQRALDILRVKGIVRQHRGQVHTSESVEDIRQLYTVRFFWPAGR